MNDDFDDEIDDEFNDPTYQPERLTPKKRGLRIEYLLGSKTTSHCCNAELLFEKVNNPVTDFRCKQCSRGIQVKSTQNWSDQNFVTVTKPSENGTIDNPITIYKVLIKEDLLYMKIFSPDKTQTQGFYKRAKTNRWGQPVLSIENGRITKLKKIELGDSWF
jgi:hypothetical protein